MIELEGYFDFLDTQDIRIKGTRIGIEIVIEDFLDGARQAQDENPPAVVKRIRQLKQANPGAVRTTS